MVYQLFMQDGVDSQPSSHLSLWNISSYRSWMTVMLWYGGFNKRPVSASCTSKPLIISTSVKCYRRTPAFCYKGKFCHQAINHLSEGVFFSTKLLCADYQISITTILILHWSPVANPPFYSADSLVFLSCLVPRPWLTCYWTFETFFNIFKPKRTEESSFYS